ncbi:MAG TPA: rRNA maturation RNase YbeY [Bacteroidetes bacterium]|nr:rRNA maturation RNase YbeY [Bacteroidota bacterium]
MSTPEINFFNEDRQVDLLNKESIVKKLLGYISENNRNCGVINYIFCSDSYLLDLNKRYLNHDYFTDILSFQMDEDPISGDIFISIDRVEENAKDLNVPFQDEVYRVISHGLLHFMGYKDKTEEQKMEMRKKENEIIEILSRT